MRDAYSRKVTLLTVLAALKSMRSQLPGLLLLASQRVEVLPSLAIAGVRLLPDLLEALAVPLSARLTPPPPEEELLEELLELLLEDEELLEDELDPPEDDELDEDELDPPEELLDEDEPPHPAATSAASFRPLPAPAEAIAMHFIFSAGCSV